MTKQAALNLCRKGLAAGIKVEVNCCYGEYLVTVYDYTGILSKAVSSYSAKEAMETLDRVIQATTQPV